MAVQRSLGTTITKGGTNIGRLTSIGTPAKTAESLETTTMDVADGYKTFMAGLKDGGEIVVKGFFDITDPGQALVDASFENATLDTYIITFPATIGATFTFTGIITKFDVGDANVKDPLGFELTVKVSSRPVIGVSASAGMSALTANGTSGTLSPTVAATTYFYSYTFITSTTLNVTPTAAGQTIKMYVDDVYVQDIVSGSASGAIAFAAAGVTHKIVLVVFGAGQNPKIYTTVAVRTA